MRSIYFMAVFFTLETLGYIIGVFLVASLMGHPDVLALSTSDVFINIVTWIGLAMIMFGMTGCMLRSRAERK